MNHKFISSLLTVKDVAGLLQIKERTVYDNRKALGGFYPAGIKVLRFRAEVIYGIMEGQGHDQEGGNFSPGTAKAPGQTKSYFRLGPTDPDRHGLPRGREYVSDQKQKAKKV